MVGFCVVYMAPTIVVLAGYPGVGKSFVAREIQKQVGATVFRTDAIRKELFSNPTYSREESQKTYDELFSRAEESVKSGETVVLDATFSLQVGRENVAEIGRKQECDVVFIQVTCDESVVRERIESRDGLSDADFSVYQKVRDSFESFEREYETIDNSGSKSQTRETVSHLVKSSGV